MKQQHPKSMSNTMDTKRAMALGALLLLVLLTSACASSSMPVARQLKSGEINLAATADSGVVPRVGARMAVGMGDVGDVSASASTNLWEYNSGVGARLYLADWMTLGTEASYGLNILGVNEDRWGPQQELRSANRLTFQYTEDRRGHVRGTFYGGGEVMFVWNDESTFDQIDFRYAALGAFVGGELMLDRHVGVQTEALIRPMWRDYRPRPGDSYGEVVGPLNTYGAFHTWQFSVGLTYYFN